MPLPPNFRAPERGQSPLLTLHPDEEKGGVVFLQTPNHPKPSVVLSRRSWHAKFRKPP